MLDLQPGIARDLNSCYRKKVFRSEKNAQKKADYHNQVSPPPDGKVFHAYFCGVCGNFHVGRTNNPR